MNLIEHNLLTLDFWQDHVTYEGKSMPTGTLACAALNLPDEVIAKLSRLCMPLNLYMVHSSLDRQTQGRWNRRGTPRFKSWSFCGMRRRFPFLITDMSKAKWMPFLRKTTCKMRRTLQSPGASPGRFRRNTEGHDAAARIAGYGAHGYSLGEFKRELIPFAEKLHGSDRTADSYAASFGQFFSGAPDLSSKTPAGCPLQILRFSM